MVLGQKKQLFPRENQKSNLFGVWPYSFPKDGFFFLIFWFFLGKSWFFGPKPSVS